MNAPSLNNTYTYYYPSINHYTPSNRRLTIICDSCDSLTNDACVGWAYRCDICMTCLIPLSDVVVKIGKQDVSTVFKIPSQIHILNFGSLCNNINSCVRCKQCRNLGVESMHGKLCLSCINILSHIYKPLNRIFRLPVG
jgi:hypothetical protein